MESPAANAISTQIIQDDRRLGLLFEANLMKWRQVLQIRQFHIVGELSKSQTWNNTPMRQAFAMSTSTPRESSGVNHPGSIRQLDI
jgi:hypothetical protein